MRKILAALGATALGVMLAVGALGGAAHNGDGTAVAFGHSTGGVVQNADGSSTITSTVTEPMTVDLTGKTQSVATGTTTKCRVLNSTCVWSFKIWWDDSPAGSAYKVTQIANWNPCTSYSELQWRSWYPNGTYDDSYANCNVTAYWNPNITGTATTKTEPTWGILKSSGAATDPSGCVYLTPTGGSESNSDCSV
jgi:hypothetical protein